MRDMEIMQPDCGKYRDTQIAQISSWHRLPDEQTALAAMHSIHVVPSGSTTVTYVNPLDPGNPYDSEWYFHDDAKPDRLIPAGRP